MAIFVKFVAIPPSGINFAFRVSHAEPTGVYVYFRCSIFPIKKQPFFRKQPKSIIGTKEKDILKIRENNIGGSI